MNPTNRRTFLTLAGTGAAMAGVAAVAPSAVAAPAPSKTPLPADASGAVMAHVKDLRAGQVSVMSAGHEVVVTDHELVARLAQAIAKAQRS